MSICQHSKESQIPKITILLEIPSDIQWEPQKIPIIYPSQKESMTQLMNNARVNN